MRKQAKCLEEISFVSVLICTLCAHNLPAQHAATEISSLGTFRVEIISFVKSAILYLEFYHHHSISAVQGIRNSLLSTRPVQAPDATAIIGTTAAKTVSQKLCQALCKYFTTSPASLHKSDKTLVVCVFEMATSVA